MPRRKTRSSSRSREPIERATRGSTARVIARITVMRAPGIHAQVWCTIWVSTSVAATTIKRNEPVEISCTQTYLREIWCQEPSSSVKRFADRGSISRSYAPPSSEPSVVVVRLESGVSSGLFVIVVLPDDAHVLRDQCRGHEDRGAHSGRDDGAQRA